MALEQKFFDDFDNATVDVQTDPGNGAVTEPAGTSLIASITAGQHAGWSGGSGNDNEGAPIAYETLTDHIAEPKGLLRFETRLTNLTKTGNEVFSGLTVWQDRDNAYTIGWYDANDDIYIYKIVDDVGRTNIWQAGNYGHPNTTPHIYRFYVNLTDDKVVLPEGGLLNAKSIGFVFSSNDGSTWVYAHQRAAEVAPTRFGIYALNWASTWRGCDVSFDYLKLEQDEEPLVVLTDEEGKGNEGTRTSFEDRVRVGEHHPQDQKGQTVFEDRIRVLEAGGDKQHTTLQQSTGQLQETKTYFNEQLRVINPDADYVAWKQDGDGQDLLQDIDVQGVTLFDATEESFGDPTNENHTGIARDGKYYYDGDECAPGDFGTVAGGPRRTAWPYWSGGAEPRKQAISAGSLTMPSDDVLRFQGTGMSSSVDDVRVTSQRGWRFRGDFDIEVEYLDLSFSGGSDGGLIFHMFADNYNQFYVRRRVGGANVYDKDVKINNSWGSYASTATTDTAGKLRIVRSGTVVSQYYWDGVSSWVQIGSSTDMAAVGAVPVWVIIGIQGVGSLNADVKATNFTINSGTTDNTARWTWESSGTHRGTQATMPAQLAVVTTKSSLDLIDTTSNKLWMRFVQGTNNVMGATATGVRVRQAVWDNGLLFVAYGNETGGGGAAIWIDFTEDEIRWHREAAAADTGGLYAYPSLWARGIISERNNAKGYNQDYAEWQIPSYKVDDVDLLRSGVYEYRAAATYAGMAMFRYERWYGEPTHEYSLSTETGHMRWCHIDQSNGELFYADATTMYSRDKTGAFVGWEDVMSGGTFTAQYSKSLPGTRHIPSQYQAVRYSTYLFIPAWEGVYRVNWPSGSWELFYGKVGSGATHEILPDYSMVLSIALGKDGTDDLLAIGVRFPGLAGGQIIIAKLVDDSVYGKSPIQALEDPRYMGAL